MNESRYAAIGVDPGELTASNKAVIDSLTEAEFALLAGVRARLDDADGDVQGHIDTFNGGTFWRTSAVARNDATAALTRM